ncbi:hypothetical protein ZWY2020_001296 [Hordeum vulgare]|nr:hypothetical protein ZWY2020_001296 [Hordeum vulgare]
MAGGGGGKVACAAWIRRREDKATRVAVHGPPCRSWRPSASTPGPARSPRSPGEDRAREDPDDAPLAVAVHPPATSSCATARGAGSARLCFSAYSKCLAFSTDGAKFAIGGEDGHLRIFHWPSMKVS